MEVHVNGESQWIQEGWDRTRQGKPGEMQSWVRDKALGAGSGPSHYSPLPLLASSGMSVWVRKRVGGWAGTYHIQGLPMGKGVGGAAKRRKHNLANEAWTPPTPTTPPSCLPAPQPSTLGCKQGRKGEQRMNMEQEIEGQARGGKGLPIQNIRQQWGFLGFKRKEPSGGF